MNGRGIDVSRLEIEPSSLSFYAQPSITTDVGRHRLKFEGLPRDVATLTELTQGLVLHEHMAPAYGVLLSGEETSHRLVKRLVDDIAARDVRPLDQPRAATSRVTGNCWHFVMLLVAMLRVHGTPARARCGFASYFNDGRFEDHWVCEYWHAGEGRWVLVDAQVDGMQRSMFEINFDPLDVPRDQFIVAGQAWAWCRADAADPSTFGLSVTGLFGQWYVARNLMRDAAALLALEMPPDDSWADMPRPHDAVDDQLSALLDDLGTLTQGDPSPVKLHRLCSDNRLRVPGARRELAD